MATMQLQKTRMAETKTKTVMTQKQSLEVVQTLLHGGLSSLAYLRAWFAEKAFSQQNYSSGSGGRIPSYRDYVNGNLAKPSAREDGLSTSMMRLNRKQSKRADVFLDWLEKGVFVALKDGTLKALQVYVHTDPDDRDKVVETYTFTIKYHSDGQGGRLYAGLEIDSPGEHGITVEATSKALHDLLRHIIKTCDELPELPATRYVSMALFYLEDVKDFKVPGFEPSTSKDLVFARAHGWEKTIRSFDDMRSAFHSTSLKVSHLHQPALRALSGVAEPARIPSCLEYNSSSTREAEIATEVLPDDISTIFPDNTEVDAGRTPPTVSRAADSELAMATPAPTSAVAAKPVEDDTLSANNPTPVRMLNTAQPVVQTHVDTQSSDVPKMKQALQGMLRPELFSQGDTQTQAVRQPTASMKLTLLPNIAQRLQRDKAKLQKSALKAAGVTRASSKNSDIVLCQCGHQEEEGDMISCSFCGTWQHFHCYGFTGLEDPRMPEDHACYQCLLLGHDDELMATMKDLTTKRRVMHFALQHGLKRNKEDLAKSLNIPIDPVKSILAYLVAEGFVANPAGAHKARFSTSNKPYYVPVQEGPMYDKLQQELFDPLRHVNSYYANASSLSITIAKQLRSLRSVSIPPPATPASQSRKQAAATPLQKRPLDLPAEDIFTTPAKRQARATPIYRRFQSVQTTCVLNADGLSSPALSMT